MSKKKTHGFSPPGFRKLSFLGFFVTVEFGFFLTRSFRCFSISSLSCAILSCCLKKKLKPLKREIQEILHMKESFLTQSSRNAYSMHFAKRKRKTAFHPYTRWALELNDDDFYFASYNSVHCWIRANLMLKYSQQKTSIFFQIFCLKFRFAVGRTFVLWMR